MKRFATIAIVGTLIMSLALVGCQSKASDENSGTDEPAEGAMVGAWTANAETTPSLSADEQAVFDTAAESLLGVDYEPVAVLATQLVAGTNYAFLCKGAPVVPDAETGWYIVVAYQDLQGNVEVTSAEAIDLTSIAVVADVDASDAVGAWEIATPESASILPAEAADAFAKAAEGNLGVSLTPIATLGTQLVSGTNYLVLCSGTTATAEPVTSLYVATVYADLNGGAEMTDVQLFDFLSYLG